MRYAGWSAGVGVTAVVPQDAELSEEADCRPLMGVGALGTCRGEHQDPQGDKGVGSCSVGREELGPSNISLPSWT